MALKTLWCCGDASSLEQRSSLRAIHTLKPPPKYIHKLGGLLPIHSMHQRGGQGLMWGTRGPFLLAASMVMAVVMPVVFCAKATEILKNAKHTKISCFYRMMLSTTIYCKTYWNSCIANCSVARAQVAGWSEPEQLWSNAPRHIGYHRKALVIVRTILTMYWGQNRGILEKERKGYPHWT